MTKPLVYNYKTAEDEILALKEIVNYMAKEVEKLKKENDRYYQELRNMTIKNRIIEADLKEAQNDKISL